MSHPSSQQPSQNIYHGKSWYKTNSSILLCVGDNSVNSSPMLFQIQRQIGEIPTWLGCRPCSVTVPNPSRGWWLSSFAAMLRGDESRGVFPWSFSESTPHLWYLVMKRKSDKGKVWQVVEGFDSIFHGKVIQFTNPVEIARTNCRPRLGSVINELKVESAQMAWISPTHGILMTCCWFP